MANNRILIADDEADLTEIIGAVAEDLGFQVTVVHEGSEVVSRVSAVDPGVIVLDLRMPGADGIEVLNELADIGSKASILLMSGLGQSTLNSVGHVGKEKNLNVVGTLTKPITPDDIETALEPLLQAAPAEDADTAPAVSDVADSGFGLRTQFLAHTQLADESGSAVRATLAGSWVLDNNEEVSRDKFENWAHAAGISKGLFDRILRDALQSSRAKGATNGDLVLGIKLGNETLGDEKTVEHLSTVIDNCSFPISNFVLEIHEDDINRDYGSAAALLSRLRIKGFRIAVISKSSSDDLLAMIDKLPMDEIIIDLGWLERSNKVTSDMELEFSYSSLGSMARKKGITTCADNVNNNEVFEFARRCGFSQARGSAIQDYQPIANLAEA